MPDSRYSYWITEQAPGYRGPTSTLLLQLAALALVVVLAWSWFDANGAAMVDRKPGVSFCEGKAGRPGWDSVCRETARR